MIVRDSFGNPRGHRHRHRIAQLLIASRVELLHSPPVLDAPATPVVRKSLESFALNGSETAHTHVAGGLFRERADD